MYRNIFRIRPQESATTDRISEPAFPISADTGTLRRNTTQKPRPRPACLKYKSRTTSGNPATAGGEMLRDRLRVPETGIGETSQPYNLPPAGTDRRIVKTSPPIRTHNRKKSGPDTKYRIRSGRSECVTTSQDNASSPLSEAAASNCFMACSTTGRGEATFRRIHPRPCSPNIAPSFGPMPASSTRKR